MIKGAPVTPEASTISGASATTEVQNNSAEVQNNCASASDPVDAEAPAKILIPLEHWHRHQSENFDLLEHCVHNHNCSTFH